MEAVVADIEPVGGGYKGIGVFFLNGEAGGAVDQCVYMGANPQVG